MAYIYKIVNDINQKIYIGKTERSVEERWREHCKDYNRRDFEIRPLYRAFKKYGIENFHIELIEETDNPEDREVYWIEYYDSFGEGYNATLGGDGKKYLDYDLIYATYKETQNVNETARIIGCSKDSVSRVVRNKGEHPTPAKALSKKVAKCDIKTKEIIEVYSSVSSAEKANGNSRHIADVCNGKRKSAKGFFWKYI